MDNMLNHAEVLRDELPPGGSIDAALKTSGLQTEATLLYSHRQFPLREALTEVLDLPCELESLHSVLSFFSLDREHHGEVMRAKVKLLLPLTDEKLAAPFFSLYEDLVLQELAPQLNHALGREPSPSHAFYFPVVPTLRVQQPSQLRQIRPHCDGIYGLQEGAINFWLPLTPLEPTSTLHVESSPGMRDFHPLLPNIGELVRSQSASVGRSRVRLNQEFRYLISC